MESWLSPLRGSLINNNSLWVCEFVGNGLDRSGIGSFTAMLYKIRIEYNIHRLEPERKAGLLQPRFGYSKFSKLNPQN